MKVYLNEITGIPRAITSMFMSKRTWSREMEEHINEVCELVLDRQGRLRTNMSGAPMDEYNDWLDKLTRWGSSHITMLRFVGLDYTVEGLHRGGQDDWDSHTKRFDNRIIRSSTRLATFGSEISDWYKDKIIPTDNALEILGIDLPDYIYLDKNGKTVGSAIDAKATYIRRTNGYIVKEYADNPDAKRGLYMLSIPSNFVSQMNLTEFGHVFKERNIHGTANPEVKECCESLAEQVESFQPRFNRDLLNAIKN